MQEKMTAAFGPDAKTESGGQHPCRAAKLECSTPSGEKELEGDCLRKWNLCGHALGFPWMKKDGSPAKSSGSCPCGQAKKRCLAPDGAHLLDGECADLWSKCDKLKEEAAWKRKEQADGTPAKSSEDPDFDTWSREQYESSIDTEVRHMSAQQP
jgi:hypothetical protein